MDGEEGRKLGAMMEGEEGRRLEAKDGRRGRKEFRG